MPGRAAATTTSTRRAVELIGRTDFAEWHGKIRLDLGEVLRLSGKPEEAAATITESIEILERKADIATAARAREALAALPRGSS